MNDITIVGLGPGNPELITLEAWKVLQAASEVLVWAADPADLPAGPSYRFLGAELPAESSVDYEALNNAIAGMVCADGVVYAVPGSPYVFNDSVNRVQELAAERGLRVRVVNGLSPVLPALAAVQGGAADGLQLFSATLLSAMYHPPLNPDLPAMVGEFYTSAVWQSVARVLLNQYPATHPVRLILQAGTEREQIVSLPLNTLAAAPQSGPSTLLYVPPVSTHGSFESLQETMAHLRSPQGCPWDREQDHLTLRPYLLEEVYEVLDALDRGDLTGLAEELGDLLLQVAFHVQVAVDAGEFYMTDVIEHINHKLIHRHPHVWGDVDVNGSGDVARNWEAIKKQERRDNGKARDSLLDGVSKALPALAQAYNYQMRAARVGFDWDRIEPVIDKIREEIAEIQAAEDADHRAREIGDLLFALVNWTRWMDVEPETALREANQRFYRRFHFIEQSADAAGRALSSMTLEEMDALWDAAKARGL